MGEGRHVEEDVATGEDMAVVKLTPSGSVRTRTLDVQKPRDGME